jgi:hypothetical protein
MAQFLRDEQLKHFTLTEERLTQLYEAFHARRQSMPEEQQQPTPDEVRSFLYSVIRFDSKGYRYFSLDQLLSQFRRADYVERVIFTLESAQTVRNNRNVGSYMELRLDNKDPATAYLQVASDDEDWVNASFSAIKETLNRYKNRYGWARSVWSQLAVQIGGVLIGFLLSLWAAIKISPAIDIENAFFITFLFALLVFSNIWTYLNQAALRIVNSIFPSIKFYRPDRDRLHWLLQAVVGGIVVALVLVILNLLFEYVGQILGERVLRGR